MTYTLATAGEPTLWTLFGRFHPATVHFPIALVTIAAVVELLQIVRKRPLFAAATGTLTVVGAVSAIVAAAMGLANATGRKPDDVLEVHRWAGLATTAVSVLASILVIKGNVRATRVVLLLGMIGVGLTGHWGGVLVHGPEYYESAVPSWLKPRPALPLQTPRAPTAGVDFVKVIAPILKQSCIKCHGGEKGVKGKLDLTTQATAMKGGKVIVAGAPDQSTLYLSLFEGKTDTRMPDKAKPLPEEQIGRIGQWIKEGAVWPDGYVFEK